MKQSSNGRDPGVAGRGPSTRRGTACARLNAQALIRDVSGLVSPPHVCARVFELMRSTDASAKDFGHVIGQDPNLTARLLRVANSSFFNFSCRIDTVSRAVTAIGLNELYTILIAVSAVQSFSRIPNHLVNMDTYWRHSVFCGLLARGIARRANVLHPERLFVAGLLHDIGSLVLFHRIPEQCGKLLLAADGDEQALYEAEIGALGFSHAEVGSLLLTLWNLPPALPGAVRGHHDPSRASVGAFEAGIVKIADTLANQISSAALHLGGCPEREIAPSAWSAIGLDPSETGAREILDTAEAQLSDTVEVMMVAL